MKIIDLNGTGEWSVIRLRERYRVYCGELGCAQSIDLASYKHTNKDRRWIYPFLKNIIEGIREKDPACVALGIDLVESDQKIPFGQKLKSKTARELRRSSLSDQQKARLRKRIVRMLIAGIIPHEFTEYYKLLRTIGVEDIWPDLHSNIPRDNRFAMRFYNALLQNDPNSGLPNATDRIR
jgi:hypothetical protein